MVFDEQAIVAPHLAQVANVLLFWKIDMPLPVPAALYRQARAEMEAVSKARGFPLPQDEMLKRHGQDHFLLLGKPVIANG